MQYFWLSKVCRYRFNFKNTIFVFIIIQVTPEYAYARSCNQSDLNGNVLRKHFSFLLGSRTIEARTLKKLESPPGMACLKKEKAEA